MQKKDRAASTSDTVEASKEHSGTTPPAPDFSTFVLSLSTSALVHLGEVKDPQTGKVNKDLAMAKQTIDILAILKEKTHGNLSKDEQTLLDNILYELRMKYLRASKAI